MHGDPCRIFGGQWSDGWINTSAVNISMRLGITISSTNGSYSFGNGWQAEVMPTPRVVFSSVLLPNGFVLLMGGAMVSETGTGGGGQGAARRPGPVRGLWWVRQVVWTKILNCARLANK
jgi:hypothetical protein